MNNTEEDKKKALIRERVVSMMLEAVDFILEFDIKTKELSEKERERLTELAKRTVEEFCSEVFSIATDTNRG